MLISRSEGLQDRINKWQPKRPLRSESDAQVKRWKKILIAFLQHLEGAGQTSLASDITALENDRLGELALHLEHSILLASEYTPQTFSLN